METASLSKIKKELESFHPTQLQQLLIRLTKYKKENKELLSYLLYDADDENLYIENVKKEIDNDFSEIKILHWFAAKKRLQKTVRTCAKYIKFSGSERTETEIRLHLCRQMQKLPQNHLRQRIIANIFIRQIEATRKSIGKLHEDLQADYNYELDKITNN